MVFPETKEIILEAKKQYLAYENYVKYLDKKVLAFQKKKVEVFQERHDLKDEYTKEFMKGINERKRLLLLEKRNIGVDPSSSRMVEMDFEEMRKLKETLKPSETKIKEIQERLETLKFTETKQRLNHEVSVALSMHDEVVWSLMKASIYEARHREQENWKTEVLQKWRYVEKEMAKRGWEYHVSPKHEDFWSLETKDLWKTVAEKQYKEYRKKFYENLEKSENERRKEQENEEWNKKKRLYNELIRKEREEND